MPKVTVFNVSGAQVGELELADSVFGIEPNAHVMHSAVLLQNAAERQGTHKTKDAPKYVAVDVSLGNKKVQVALVKVASVLHNGLVVVQYLAQHLALMDLSFLRKFVVLRSNLHFLLR